MIDLQIAKKAFKDYIKNYNPDDEKVKLKIAHMQRTSQVAKNIAEKLNLEKEDIELAELIGLLHDIGRFEQIRIYNTFVDKNSVNHGQLGVKILFEQGLIRKFIEDTKYDNIIRIAILNHNKYSIQENLKERELLHAKIIRDSDKTDILYTLTFGDKKAIWESEDLSNDWISDEIYREFMEEHKIDYTQIKSSADILVSHFAYVFDFNFKIGLEFIKKKGYIDQLYKRFVFNQEETKERYNNIYTMTKKVMEEVN